MNIGAYLHSRWAADAVLNGLLPVAKLVTGEYTVADPSVPYATMFKTMGRPDAYDNDGACLDRQTIQITIHHGRDHYDEGAAIVEAVKNCFGRAAFDVSGSGKVINMQRTGDWESQDGDGNWVFAVQFDCRVYVPSGSGV